MPAHTTTSGVGEAVFTRLRSSGIDEAKARQLKRRSRRSMAGAETGQTAGDWRRQS